MDNTDQKSNHLSVSEQTRFFSIVSSATQERGVHLMIKSLRKFGGEMAAAPLWVFYWSGYRSDPAEAEAVFDGIDGVQLLSLDMDDVLSQYFFGGKVSACAQAEALAPPEVKQILWFASDCLMINPPLLFELGPNYDAAFRTVHHRNIGLLLDEPLDAFWKVVYSAVGLEDTAQTMESYVDCEAIRPYFNSHIFAIDPGKGLMERWLGVFLELVLDQSFQSASCSDQLHQIFLHQAVLSALLTMELDWPRIRQLPAEYSYPLHFHKRVSEPVRPSSLDDLVCIAYEDLDMRPDSLENIQVHEPLRSWLVENT